MIASNQSKITRMKRQSQYLFLLMILFMAPPIAFTQPPPPPPPVDTRPSSIPFDGISAILIAAGAGYAIQKGRRKSVTKKETRFNE